LEEIGILVMDWVILGLSIKKFGERERLSGIATFDMGLDELFQDPEGDIKKDLTVDERKKKKLMIKIEF
jgi:hypothetical protein